MPSFLLLAWPSSAAVHDASLALLSGDAKYIAKDLLESRPSTAADVFSFGITLLEVKRGQELPGHGEEWEALRAGGAAQLPSTATSDAQLVALIQGMMSARAEERLEAFARAVALPPTVPLPPPASAEPSKLALEAQQLSASRLRTKHGSDVASLIVNVARKLGRSGRSGLGSGSLFSPR